MATTIVSISARDIGLGALSSVLLWLAVAAFVSLAALDLWLARHPLALLRRAARPGQGFHALGFVSPGARRLLTAFSVGGRSARASRGARAPCRE